MPTGNPERPGFAPVTEGERPVFSIITISYNAAAALRRTIESVNAQTYASIEHVLIDGGSTDGSQELISSLARRRPNALSEPDRGIADAFNKGTTRARGEYVCYMNAGDVFESADVLERVAAAIAAAAPAPAAIYFGDFISVLDGVPRRHVASAALADFAWDNPINHQSAFVPRALAVAHPYDERLALGMDYDFWLRVIDRAAFRKLDFPICLFEMGGRSSAAAWEVHSLVIHRTLWHINRGTRFSAGDLAVLTARTLRFKILRGVRAVLGRRLSLAARAAKSRWHARKPEPAATLTAGPIS